MSPRALPFESDRLTEGRKAELDHLFATGHHGQALELLLEHVTYKPGWTFKVESPDPIPWRAIAAGYQPETPPTPQWPDWPPRQLVMVVVNARVQDSGNPGGSPVVVTHRRPVDAFELKNCAHALHWLFSDLVMSIEHHEASEFFRLDGVAPYWPHRDEPVEGTK